jgi:hypothetical protein
MHRTAVALALLLLTGTGCGPSGEISVDVKDGSGKTARVNAGVAGTVSLPSSFPKDVPSPKDSTVAASISQGSDIMVNFRAKGTVPEASAFYQERLKAEGWTLKPVMELDGTSSVIEAAKDKRKCMVMITPGEGETIVQVHTSPQ